MENTPAGVQSVARIFAIIEVLSKHSGGASLQDISKETTLAKSTVHRLLSSLVSLGYVVQDSFTTQYRLTLKMFELSSGIVNDMDLLSVAKPHLDRLAHETGNAVHLVIPDGAEVVYIYKAESGDTRMASHVGRRVQMYCTAVGKAILATHPYADVENVWQRSTITQFTEYTIMTFESLIQELKQVKKYAYAMDNEENELGIRCLAVSIAPRGKCAQAAFSISGLAPSFTNERRAELAQIAMETRSNILRDLGW